MRTFQTFFASFLPPPFQAVIGGILLFAPLYTWQNGGYKFWKKTFYGGAATKLMVIEK